MIVLRNSPLPLTKTLPAATPSISSELEVKQTFPGNITFYIVKDHY